MRSKRAFLTILACTQNTFSRALTTSNTISIQHLSSPTQSKRISSIRNVSALQHLHIATKCYSSNPLTTYDLRTKSIKSDTITQKYCNKQILQTNPSIQSPLTSNITQPLRKLPLAIIKQVSWSFFPLQIYQHARPFYNLESWQAAPDVEQKITAKGEIKPPEKKHQFTNISNKSTIKPFTPSKLPSKIILDPNKHIHVIYIDPHIIVLNKPSGILSVPGPNRKPSLLNLVYDNFGGNESKNIDKMVVHRLDMDTSGIVIYARSDQAMFKLNQDFRDRKVKKTYEALVCGHVNSPNNLTSESKAREYETLYQYDKVEGEIDLPLQRDHLHPPFMRVATTESEIDRYRMLEKMRDKKKSQEKSGKSLGNLSGDSLDYQRRMHAGFQKMMGKEPKQSLTQYSILSREIYEGLPVTRMNLIPVTGR